MNPDTDIKFKVWFKKTDLPIWIDADFENMNISVDNQQRKTLYIGQTNRNS